MKLKMFAALLLALSGVLISPGAGAVPVMWTFEDVVFNDNSRVSGSYRYDADLNQWSDWSITVGDGTMSSFTYDTSNSSTHWVNRGASGFLLVDTAYSRYINFNFVASMSNSGGLIDLETATRFSGFGSGSWECYNCSRVRWISAGSIRSVNVAEPPVLVLLALGLLLLPGRSKSD